MTRLLRLCIDISCVFAVLHYLHRSSARLTLYLSIDNNQHLLAFGPAVPLRKALASNNASLVVIISVMSSSVPACPLNSLRCNECHSAHGAIALERLTGAVQDDIPPDLLPANPAADLAQLQTAEASGQAETQQGFVDDDASKLAAKRTAANDGFEHMATPAQSAISNGAASVPSNGAHPAGSSASASSNGARPAASPAAAPGHAEGGANAHTDKQATAQPSPANPAPPPAAAAAFQVSKPALAAPANMVADAARPAHQSLSAAAQNGAVSSTLPSPARSTEPKPVFPVPLTVEEEVDQVWVLGMRRVPALPDICEPMLCVEPSKGVQADPNRARQPDDMLASQLRARFIASHSRGAPTSL